MNEVLETITGPAMESTAESTVESNVETTVETANLHTGQTDHSYKFQRLRERIRQAVASGELAGKLPGERELARRFQVNAKTLSKALTDLAAEGLLSRSIGRGTFVRTSQTERSLSGSWLLVCDADQVDSPLVKALQRVNPDAKLTHDVTSPRPSFINQFSAVVDMASATPEAFVRDMLVRNLPLVVVDRQPQTYSTSAVLLDVAYVTSQLGRDLLLGGHRHIAAVETKRDGAVTSALRIAAGRYAPDATIASCLPSEAMHQVQRGATALICGSVPIARHVANLLITSTVSIPQSVSVAAMGTADGDYPCTGFFVESNQQAEAIEHLLRQGQSAGGAPVLWLTGRSIDRGTTAAAPTSRKPLMTLTA
jgi:DNA-binding transcriptional regulator YhcF (GntR family)